MDYTALVISIKIALLTCLILLPIAIMLARILALFDFFGKWLLEFLVVLPLVLPPTVMGYYLLVFLGKQGLLGGLYFQLFGYPLVFNQLGLIVGSVIFNLPFGVYPILRSFSAIDKNLFEAASLCGLSPLKTFLRIELPLILPGILSALILIFSHSLGEFGIVLMIGGSIPGETKTLSIAIYEAVSLFDLDAANKMATLLLVLSALIIYLLNLLEPKKG